MENPFHSRDDQAISLKHSLQVLYVLTRQNGEDNASVPEIIESINFWMADCSQDGSVALDELGIHGDKL